MAVEFTSKQEERIGEYFRISVFIKGAVSLIEIIAGVLAFFVPVSSLTDLVVRLAQGELAEEPGDFIATHLVALAHQFSFASGVFIGVYLLSRGVVKFALVVALLKNKLWAYPTSLVVLGLFVLYQIYQIVIAFSALLVFLTILDLIVMWFIWREYEVVRFHTV
jgi:uncharacterized membrane protein